MKIIDIIPRPGAIEIKIRRVYRKQTRNFRKRSIFGFAAIGLVLALASLPLIFAFEAHVINVTAKIEGCDEFEIRSRGYWKNHEEDWILPQTVGVILISPPEEAEDMLNAHADMTDKL